MLLSMLHQPDPLPLPLDHLAELAEAAGHGDRPALVLREGYGVVHLDVVDRSRMHGASNYGIFDRGLQGILDLYGVWWLKRRIKRLPVVSEIGNDNG